MPADDPIDAARLRAALGDRWPRVEVVERTGSTNADLLAAADLPHRTLRVAEHQVAGRGRLDRQWESPPRAGLTFSVAVRPAAPLVAWGWLPLLAGVALAEAVTATCAVDVALKWPNDLLAADGRKLAGILVQTAGAAAVIGIGLNVSTGAGELPVATATSLRSLGADRVDRTGLLAAAARGLDERLTQWDGAGGDAVACGLAAAYRARCATLGAPVRVELAPQPTVSGTAVDIDPAGRLVVRTSAGDVVVGAGDVVHVRNSGT